MGCYNPTAKRDRVKHRVERLIKTYALNKDTVETTRIDTHYTNHTVTIPEVQVDTQFIWGYKDTIWSYEDNGVFTKIEFIHDTLRLKTTVFKRDTVVQFRDVIKTVIKTVPISVEPESPKKQCRIPLLGIPCWYIWLPFILIICFFVGRGAIKLYKEWQTTT